jgi:hypothetical protein
MRNEMEMEYCVYMSKFKVPYKNRTHAIGVDRRYPTISCDQEVEHNV